MDITDICPDCGAVWEGNITCAGYFHRMLFWEAQFPAYAEQVHHLMVLCYHLQHPGLYTPDGLGCALGLLADFVVRGLPPAEARRRGRQQVDSSRRAWKVTGSAARGRGSYDPPVGWTMTAADVVAGGPDAYCDNVCRWADSMVAALRAAGHLPG
jgi:hypothetical protein